MFRSLFSNTRRNLIAGLTAAAVFAGVASPASAWGLPEQNFVAGAATGLLLGGLFNNYGRSYYYAPRPVYVAPRPVYVYRPPVVYRAPVCYRFCYYRPAPLWGWRGPWH